MLFTSSPLQSATYLLGVCLFSIAFLVFLNASVSFVITDRIQFEQKSSSSLGDYVGTLGFADELLALIACPIWGLLSDRIGIRAVCTLGYAIIAASLAVFVQAKNVYPQLLLARLFFSVGGAAVTTMVTATLPAVTNDPAIPSKSPTSSQRSHNPSDSLASDLTITPERHRNVSHSESRSSLDQAAPEFDPAASSSQVAGIVGTFTGLGALVAVGILLPLPARFIKAGASPGQAVADAYYVVAAIALIISVVCFVGLKGISDSDVEEAKRSDKLDGGRLANLRQGIRAYGTLLVDALSLVRKDMNVGLAYFGGAVARASSVGISLFVPLYIHNYFIISGRCSGSTDPGQGAGGIKRTCPEAYILSAQLTGTSQLAALIIAPLIGYLSASPSSEHFNIPLILGSAFGLISYILFPFLHSPLPSYNPSVFVLVIFIGLSQITAIVCSLGLLSRALHVAIPVEAHADGEDLTAARETSPLLGSATASSHPRPIGRPGCATKAYLKGSAAGLYSLAGGAGILILTKLGGWLFDKSPGAPFWILAGFNGVLLIAGLVTGFFGRRAQNSGKDTANVDTG